MQELTSLLGVRGSKITHRVTAKATYHRDIVEVFEPNNPYDKLEEGWEELTPSGTSKSPGNTESNLERSLRRTKRTVKHLASYNDFDLWVTLTIGEDRENDEKSLYKLHRWLHNQKRRHGSFRYLLVPERHKKGQLHFHGLFGSYKGGLTEAINNNRNSKYYGRKLIQKNREVFNLSEYELGYNKVERIDSPHRISSYITKYVTKDIPQIGKHKKRYWASKGLAVPPTEDNPDWFAAAKPHHSYFVSLKHGNLWFFPRDVIPANGIT